MINAIDMLTFTMPRKIPIVDDLTLTVLPVGRGYLGAIPLAPGQLKFLIVRMNYFTKWIEQKVVAKITPKRSSVSTDKESCVDTTSHAPLSRTI